MASATATTVPAPELAQLSLGPTEGKEDKKGILDFEDEVPGEGDEEEEDFDLGEVTEETKYLGGIVRKIVEEEGPIVTVLIVEANGKLEQRTVDMTPKKNTANALLGGTGTFVGQWEEDEDNEFGDVIVAMKKRDPQNVTIDAINKHKLPFPMDKELVQGRIVLIRMNGQAVPQNLTTKDYLGLAMMQRRIKEQVDAMNNMTEEQLRELIVGEEGEEEDEGEESEDEDDMPELE